MFLDLSFVHGDEPLELSASLRANLKARRTASAEEGTMERHSGQRFW